MIGGNNLGLRKEGTMYSDDKEFQIGYNDGLKYRRSSIKRGNAGDKLPKGGVPINGGVGQYVVVKTLPNGRFEVTVNRVRPENLWEILDEFDKLMGINQKGAGTQKKKRPKISKGKKRKGKKSKKSPIVSQLTKLPKLEAAKPEENIVEKGNKEEENLGAKIAVDHKPAEKPVENIRAKGNEGGENQGADISVDEKPPCLFVEDAGSRPLFRPGPMPDAVSTPWEQASSSVGLETKRVALATEKKEDELDSMPLPITRKKKKPVQNLKDSQCPWFK